MACFLAPSKSAALSLFFLLLSLMQSPPFLIHAQSPLFLFFLWSISKKEVRAWTSVLPPSQLFFFLSPRSLSFSAFSFAVISCVSRLWLPDQAADESGRRSGGACPRGGSRPHSHMRCLRSLRLCSAWQWGKMRALRRDNYCQNIHINYYQNNPEQGTWIWQILSKLWTQSMAD